MQTHTIVFMVKKIEKKVKFKCWDPFKCHTDIV